MPRIPTYTASLTAPPQRTGEELSASSAERTGAAMQGLGHELQRAGAIGMNISAQIMREKELRFAADASQRFTEESIRWQQDNGDREDSGEEFKKWSDQRIGQLASEAPNGRGAEAFKLHVLPQANSDWRQNLARGEAVRLSNFKVGEDAASQASQDAFRFRFTQGNPVEAQNLFVTDLKNKITRITSAYGTAAPAHAANMNESAIVSAVLGAAEQNPNFARWIVDEFPLVDASKRATLLAHIDAKEESMSTVDRANTLHLWQNQRENAWETLKPMAGQKDYSIFGKNAEAVREQQEQQDRIVNEAIYAFGGMADKNYGAQQAALKEYANLDQNDPALTHKRAVGSMLAARSEQSRQQQTLYPFLWLSRENSAVSEADAEWESANADAAKAGNPAEKTALLAKARGYRGVAIELNLHFQGAPPPGANPDHYLFRNSNDMQVMTPAMAKSYSDIMVKGGAETADQAMMEFSASFPPEHLGTAWANLSTLPPDGHKLPVSWQFASTIVDPIVRKRFLGAGKFEKDIAGLTDERKKQLESAFDTDIWKTFATAMVGDNYQRSSWVESARQSIMVDAMGLMLRNPNLSEKVAVKQSLKEVIAAQFHSTTSANGQPILVAVHRADWTTGTSEKPPRNDAELDHAPVALQMSLLRLPTTLIPTSSLNWLADADKKKRGDPEVEQWIQKSIMQSARWKMEPDGQSYSLYAYDAARSNEFQLLDVNNRPFVVPIDKAMTEQAKDVVPRTLKLPGSPLGGVPPRTIDATGPRKPSEVPPIFTESDRWPIARLFNPFVRLGEPITSTNMPVLGAEWINQQPGTGPNPVLDKARVFTEPRPPTPAKPKK